MAIVYNSRYTGDFCDKYGNNVIITLKHREVVPDEGVILTPIPTLIKFVGHDESPVVISYKGADNDYKLEPLNGSECTLNILADDDFQLSDLYTADEKEWMLVIGGAYAWSGFVIPDSCSEPFAYKPYPVTISATDGLGLLKDIPFANEDGTIYRGFNSDRRILKIALEKTGLSLNMVYGINTYDYSMVISEVTNPLDLTFIDQARFIDEDGNPFSCYEVIRSICARWSARLHQFGNKWQIINALELSQGDVRTYEYDTTGLFKEVGQIVNTVIAGGLNRDIQPVGNTQLAKAFKQSIGYYQYGYISNQLFNGDMNLWTNNPTGLPDGWVTFGSDTVVATTKIRQYNGVNTTDYYIEFTDTGVGGIKNTNPVQIRLNESAQVTADMVIPALVGQDGVDGSTNVYTSFLIQDDLGKFFTNTGWQTDSAYYVVQKKISEYKGQVSINFNVTPQPNDYQLTFGLIAVGLADGQHFTAQINNVDIKPRTDDATKPSIGLYTKLESAAAQSYKPEPIVLLHSDDRNEQRTSLINIGTADSGSNPIGWYRNGIVDNKPLLEIVADSELRLHSRPYRIFDAVFYGTDIETGEPTDLPYIDINTLLSVDLLGGSFMFLSGDFDLKTGNHSIRFAEVLTDEVTYIKTTAEDYGDISDTNSVGSPNGVNTTTPSSYVDTSGFASSAQLAYFLDNINSPIPIKHVWFGTTAERNALTAIDPYTYYVLTDSLTPVIEKASNVETQAGTDDAKYITPSTLANWWSYIKGIAQTITGVWRFNNNVGIGIDPTESLHVNGNIRTTGYFVITGGVIMSSPVTSTLAWTSNSIERMRLQADGRLTVTGAPTGTTDVVRLQELNAFKASDKVLSKSAAYTILATDFGSSGQVTVYVTTTSGNVNITLPTAAVMNGYTVNVIKVSSDANSVTVVGTINGLANDTLANQYDAGTYKSNGNSIYVF